ncbi:unnamed protein product [Rotaria sp. Silwood2]|nr:unnamed protein product [Rotaria sp. Silwood2]CAF2793716.1 unnamed protein product [Rotaria sp. Silwood2]CAF3082863.1 unnamed protein product [Rotaria sp. Silwood2]CAF3233283.1 unnamed protein product [Rotaria sp. Silwood2]CAF3914334.1 unnamed protein product [Rotaria sp. Silwood2]
MHLMRSMLFTIALLMIITLIQGKPTHISSSSTNIKDYIKHLLSLTGIENEYARFLSFLKIDPPTDNTKMRVLYDELFSTNAYVSDLIRLYAKSYTLDEIIELLAFYSSPLGKKTLQTTHEINRQIEDIMLTKISDYIFTSAEHGFNIPLAEFQ